MSGLDRAALIDYAREQIRAADRILARHPEAGPLCRCGRVPPCSVVTTAVDRRHHYIRVLSRLDVPPATAYAACPAAAAARPAPPRRTVTTG